MEKNVLGAALSKSEGETICSICLHKCTNRCVVYKCMHTFCFECIFQWVKINPKCPLCQQTIESLLHTIVSMDDYQTFVVKKESNMQGPIRPRPTVAPAIPMHFHLPFRGTFSRGRMCGHAGVLGRPNVQRPHYGGYFAGRGTRNMTHGTGRGAYLFSRSMNVRIQVMRSHGFSGAIALRGVRRIVMEGNERVGPNGLRGERRVVMVGNGPTGTNTLSELGRNGTSFSQRINEIQVAISRMVLNYATTSARNSPPSPVEMLQVLSAPPTTGQGEAQQDQENEEEAMGNPEQNM